ncbi:MAG: hypothetical protein G8345_08385 [Magnetococcales bacterium]|nr:hypothetical protein [Magnetococcales bacterium]NGZ26893.1 hypothetical protein [Magnetococcales bacterium]
MNLWNLLIVLCFVVLYVGLGLVFDQMRRLRDELRVHFAEKKFPDPLSEGDEDPLDEREDKEDPRLDSPSFPEETLHVLRQELANAQSRILTAINAVPARLAPELEGLHRQLQADVEAIYRQMQFMERNLSRVGRSSPTSEPSSPLDSPAEDRYTEARLLLANGMDEDRVIEKTGLTVEEVSLLKKLAMDPDRS